VDLASLDLSESVLERIAERRSDGEQRHRQIFGVCCALVRKGLDDGTILRILADPANGVSDKVLEKGHGNPEAGMRWVSSASLAPAREEVEAERDVGRMFEASDDTEPDSVQGEEAPTVLAGPALWEHRNKDAIDQLFEAEGLNAEEDRERIRQAAGLPPLTYDREAASIAKELGCSKKTLRRIVDRYRALMNLAPETSRGVAESAESGGGGDPHDGGGIADGVLALMTHVPLVRNEENDVFALVDVNGHREVLPLGGKASAMTDFRMRVLRMTKDAGIARYIPDESWANIWGSLRSDALTGEDEQSVHLRCASHGDRHYVDLCDPQWRVVEISPSGWRVIPGKDAPVLFRRTANMHPLPVPETGGDVDRLWRYVTIAEAHRPLFLAVLLSFFRTTLAYPILVLTGMEGSGKTTASRTVGELVDPKKAPTRGLPHASKDLHVRAHNNYLLAMENVSSIGDEMSDTLCRVSTGSGDAARSLYTDMDESVVEYQRPIILEGITFFLNKPDLISRSVHLEIPPLPEGQRRTDAELKARFQADKPRILGALFSLLASALALMPKVPVPGDDIRLLDFAHFGETLYRLLGLSGSPGKVSFVEHLTEVQAETRAHAMEASPTAFALVRYLRDQYEVARKQHEEDPVLYPHRPVVHYWRGTPGELLDTLTDRDVLPRGRYREGWVRSAKGMAELLRRFRKPLEEAGITVERIGRRGMGTRYELVYTPKPEDTGAGK
jgi:hypothetical protein